MINNEWFCLDKEVLDSGGGLYFILILMLFR